ncbi:MAG TPA: fatty acid desaturase [Xanthobacteraceae bacterium]|nr:fatty acid desaturase [Xanthobacteraceae bacterium]
MPQDLPQQSRTVSSVQDARAWMQTLARYREPNGARSIFEIVITVVPLVLLWAVILIAVHFGHWYALVLIIPAAGFMVRLFMIQHDCGHGSFFRGKQANDWVGRIIGIFTLTPYDFWRQTHAVHHAHSGNLELRGMGDIETYTVSEYLDMPRWRRLFYRIYRNPLFLFAIGPAYLFFLQYRLPVGMMWSNGWRPWASTMATNAGIAFVVGLMIWLTGFQSFLLVYLPIVLLAASIGVWLFYVQHQFEDTWWAKRENWNHQQAALHGSSYYDLPAVLRWFSANIGIHHVHHLSSKIPFYRLSNVLNDFPELKKIGRITLTESFCTVRLTLWDEIERRLISFREFRERYGSVSQPA